jgi:hypothetical protein
VPLVHFFHKNPLHEFTLLFVFDQEVKIHLKKNVGQNDKLDNLPVFVCACVCVCDDLIDLKQCKLNKKSQTLDY